MTLEESKSFTFLNHRDFIVWENKMVEVAQ
jgi:hypothetical protein